MPYSGLNTTFYQSYCHLKWQWPITYHMWHIEYKVTWHKILSFTFDLLYFTLLQNRTSVLRGRLVGKTLHHIGLDLFSFHTRACDSFFTGNEGGTSHPAYFPAEIYVFKNYIAFEDMFLIWTDPWSSEFNDERGFTEIFQEWLSVKKCGGKPLVSYQFQHKSCFYTQSGYNKYSKWIKSLYMWSFRVTTPSTLQFPLQLYGAV